MAIPKHVEIQPSILKLLSDSKQRNTRDFEIPLAKEFGLTSDEISQMYDSGNGPIFLDRISWALSYLNMAGLVSKPKRGVYQINEKGLKLLSDPGNFKKYISEQIEKRIPTRQKKLKVKGFELDNLDNASTPVETLYSSFQGIKQSLFREILDTILTKHPREFERCSSR